jgi:hypothetical protein
MFVSQLQTEGHITKTDAYFKSALNVAETGLNNVLTEMKQAAGATADPTASAQWGEWLSSGAHIFDPVAVETPHGTYQVTVKVVGTPVVVGNQHSAEVQVTSEGRIYTPAVTSMIGSVDYAARRAVRSNTTAVWTFVPSQPGSGPVWVGPEYEPTTFNIRYGVFTGGDLEIKGSSQEIHGDVFANGNIDIQKASGLVGGVAYAAGTVTGGIPASAKKPGQTPISFPEMDIPTMRQLFDAYVRGIYPYDGTVAGLTNTSHTAAGLINRTTFHVDALMAAARLDSTTGFYELPSMVPITSTVRSALIDPSAVYYFDGDVKLASNSALSGTIVVDGKFFISGNVEVGTSGTLVKIIATGDVTKDTGCSLINGLVYTGGSFTGRGTADINGALIARTSVDMSGNFNITYNGNIPPMTTGGTLVSAGHWTDGTAGTPASYKLDSLSLPASGDRMWQEVTDLN